MELWMILTGFLLSLFVFSLIGGDNYVFRLTASILGGVLAAVVCLFVIEKILLARFIDPLMSGNASISQFLVIAAGLLSAILLLLKDVCRKDFGMRFIWTILMGISAAAMVLGAAGGTISGLYQGAVIRFLSVNSANANGLYWLEALLVFGAAASALLYTQHYLPGRAQAERRARGRVSWVVYRVGEISVGAALGAIFAGCFTASAFILIGHLSDLIEVLKGLLAS